MRKSLRYLFTLFTLLLLLNLSVPVQAEASVDDQSCDNESIANIEGYWLIRSHPQSSQTFTPTLNRLTKISLALGGGVVAPVKMDLYMVGGGLVLTKTVNSIAAEAAWVDYIFPTVTIDTTKQYKITLTTDSPDIYWIVSTVECYAGGQAIIDGIPQSDQDFGFLTQGYNVVPALPTATAAPSAMPTITPTPMVITKPINLEGEYVSGVNGINLSWNGSVTPGIEGYNIYRSLSAATEYIKIGSVESGTTEYMDISNIEPDTTYYYQVMAFKGLSESPASNTADIEVPADDLGITLTPPAQLQDNLGSQYLPFILAGMFLFALIALILVFLIVKKSRTKKKDETPVVEEKKETETIEKKDNEDQEVAAEVVEEDVKDEVHEEAEEETKAEETESEE